LSGRRPAAVYSFATAFVTLFVTLFASAAVVAVLSSLIHHHHHRARGSLVGTLSSPGIVRAASLHPVGDAAARDAVLAALVAFVCVFIIVLSLVIALYDVFRLIAPGTFSPGAHGDHLVALHSMLPALYLAAISFGLLLMHLRHAPPPLRLGLANRLPAGPLG